jgi:hypothetical protein
MTMIKLVSYRPLASSISLVTQVVAMLTIHQNAFVNSRRHIFLNRGSAIEKKYVMNDYMCEKGIQTFEKNNLYD